MGWLRKFLQATDLQINESTGAVRAEDDALRTELEKLTALIIGGRLKTDGEFTIEQLGELVIEQVKIKNAAGVVQNPATIEGQNTGNTAIGAVADEAAVAGAVGSVSAKLRRLTTDTAAVMAAVQALAAGQFYTGQVNSGDAAKATTDDNPVACITAQTGKTIRRVRWTNTGSVAGWLLAGTTRIARLDAEATDQVDKLSIAAGTAINIQRDSAGSDLAGVWIIADYTED
jgi:hypothetical protein